MLGDKKDSPSWVMMMMIFWWLLEIKLVSYTQLYSRTYDDQRGEKIRKGISHVNNCIRGLWKYYISTLTHDCMIKHDM